MFKKYSLYIKALTLSLFLLLNPPMVKSQENDHLKKIKIEFSSKNLSLSKALDELNTLPEINIVYTNTKDFRRISIQFPSNPTTVWNALNEIKSQAPVDIIYNKNHIIVKMRELADKYNFSGSIIDAETNEKLVGVNIFLKETYKGTVTDQNGDFSLKISPGQYTIICKYIGYVDQEMGVNLYDNINIDVSLEISLQEIEEVNIIGHMGETEKLRTGRTIETIESKTIEQLNTNDLNDALHGRLNGVWVTKVSGAPGDHNKIRIRGISSIFGSTDPLYVVDGMIIPIVNFKSLGISDLNVHDVNNVTILKDASSTALYGYLGGNGVVLIETKKGGGETEFNASIKKGYQQFSKHYKLMNSEEFYNTLELSDSLIETPFYTVNPNASPQKWQLYPYYEDSLGNTLGYDNFQEQLFTTGEINEYQLSGQGNFKTIDFYISGNYYDHKGVITNTSYNKYSLTGNFSKVFKDKASIRLLYKGSHQENRNNLDNYMGNNVILKGINYEPAYYFTPDSFLRKLNRLNQNDQVSQSIESLSDHLLPPDTLFYSQEKKKIENNHSISAHGFYRLSKAFSLRSTHSFTTRNTTYSSYLPGYPDHEEKYLLSNENCIIFNQQYDLNFEKESDKHTLHSFIRFRNYTDNIYWNVDSIKNIDLNGFTKEDDVYLRGSQSIFGEKGSVIRSINSFIASFSYNYKSKYFISIIANLDNLNEGFYVDQMDIFPSVALDWDVAREEWLRFPIWFTSLHLYANWGQSGNYPLNSLSDDLFSSNSRYMPASDIKGVWISNLANHYIVHEKVTESNFGSKISLFRDRLIVSGDYYIKYNSDLLIKRDIPLYYGGGTFHQNIGEMQNKGVELSLEITPFDRPNLYWSTRFGYSSNNQIITNLDDGDTLNFNKTDILYPDFYAREYETLGGISGYKYMGIWDDSVHLAKEGELPRYLEERGLAYLKTDTSDLTQLTEGDIVTIGNSIPKFTCNWINVFEYKNFACEMLWYAVIGVDKYNATKAATYVSGLNSDVRDIVSDSMSYFRSNYFYESSYFVEDASFIRLKTLSFSYHHPIKILSKLEIRYTVSFENLLTLTNYSGYDPEATIFTNNNFTDNAMDRGAYPNPRAYYFSINIRF